MPYVQRTGQGEITGLYAMEQPEYAEEYMPESNDEVQAFRQRTESPQPTESQAE